MYPVLFRIGSFEVTSFGVLVGVAALTGIWLFGKEARRAGLPERVTDAAIVHSDRANPPEQSASRACATTLNAAPMLFPPVLSVDHPTPAEVPIARSPAKLPWEPQD